MVKERSYWSCTRKKSTREPYCPSTAITNLSGDKIIRTTEHNHPSDPVQVHVKVQEAKIVDLVKSNPRQTTDSVVGIWIKQTLDPIQRSKTCTKKSFERKIQRIKATNNQHPPVPKSFSDLEIIPEKFQQTFDRERFLLANYTGENNNDRTIIFSSSFGLNLLRSSKSWSGDGTYYITPTPFYQLYSILAEVEGHSYPAAFIFMPNKRSLTYRAAFFHLREALEVGQESAVGPEEFLVDFEFPVMKEFRSEFKSCKRIVGCFVHLKRSFWRKLGAVKHLQGFYCKQEEFYAFINSLVGLAFVPPDLIHHYYRSLLKESLPKVQTLIDQEGADPDAMQESLNQFLTFFKNNYLGSETRTGWSQPKYSPEVWSQHHQVLSGGQMTTNRNENYHLCLKKSIQMNASFWSVADALSDVEAKARLNREEHRSAGGKENSDPNSEAGTSREKRRSLRLGELRSIVEHRNEYTHVEYLRRIAGTFKLDY